MKGTAAAPPAMLNADEQATKTKLSEPEPRIIDDCIMWYIIHRLQKTARVVALTVTGLGDQFPGSAGPVVFRAYQALAEAGVIETAGNLDRMRFSECGL